jgi:hypothetical protein
LTAGITPTTSIGNTAMASTRRVTKSLMLSTCAEASHFGSLSSSFTPSFAAASFMPWTIGTAAGVDETSQIDTPIVNSALRALWAPTARQARAISTRNVIRRKGSMHSRVLV